MFGCSSSKKSDVYVRLPFGIGFIFLSSGFSVLGWRNGKFQLGFYKVTPSRRLIDSDVPFYLFLGGLAAFLLGHLANLVAFTVTPTSRKAIDWQRPRYPFPLTF